MERIYLSAFLKLFLSLHNFYNYYDCDCDCDCYCSYCYCYCYCYCYYYYYYSWSSIKWLLSTQPLFGGQRPKSWKNCQLYTIMKTSIQRAALFSGHGQLLVIPRVILFCFIPVWNGQEDLKWTFFGQMKIKECQCKNTFSAVFNWNNHSVESLEVVAIDVWLWPWVCRIYTLDQNSFQLWWSWE